MFGRLGVDSAAVVRCPQVRKIAVRARNFINRFDTVLLLLG